MFTTTILRRVAATSAAISMGGMLFLCGCNHDNDCNSCDTSPAPIVHPRVSDNDRFEVQPGQPTGYAEADEPVLENDIYFRQHRLDSTFDRNEYFRDRAAYIRAHEGDLWWNDHHIELEASWNNRRHDRDERRDIQRDERRDERNAMNGRSNTGFNREINSVQHPPSTATPPDKEREPLNTSVDGRNELQNENRNEIRNSREEQRRMETPSANLPGSEVKAEVKDSTDNNLKARESSRNTNGGASSNNPGSEPKRDNAR